MAGTSAQGTTFSFAGTQYTITSFTLSESQDLIDGSHLGIPAGGSRQYVGGFATDAEVSIDYIGDSVISAGTTGQLVFGGTFDLTTNGTVSSSSVSGSVGALISGQTTFRVA